MNFAHLIISDGATAAPDTNHTWSATSGTLTIAPSAYDADSTSPTNYPTIGHPGHTAATLGGAGAGTFASVFAGVTAAGTWKIYMVDHINTDSVSFASWTITLGISASSVSTTTSVSSNVNPSFTSGSGSSLTLTATVSTASGGHPTGTVAFKDGATTISGCGSDALSNAASPNASTATCITTFGAEGNQAITAVYTPSGSFATSTSLPVNQFVKKHSTPNGAQFCNTGGITMSGTQTAQSVYPSVINVGTDTTGFPGNPTVENVSVILNGLSTGSEGTGTVHFLLVSPSGHALDFMSGAGSGTSFGPVNLTFADAHPSLPESGSIASGTYQATEYLATDVFTPQPPSPAPQFPSPFFQAQPDGTKIFQTSFSGDATAGDWLLFAYDNGGSAAGASITGWCLNITPNTGIGTTTTLTPSPSSSTKGTAVTFTASVVKSGNVPITSGTVTFIENGAAPAGNPSNVVNMNGSGQAVYTTSGLAEGDHAITATYHDTTNTNSDSFVSAFARVDNASTPTVSGATVTYCNTGAIAIPGAVGLPHNIGPASPNPSNVFVSNLFGTINTASVQLKGLSLANLQEVQLDSLLVGPGATTANSLDFFSGGNAGLGGNGGVASGNYTFIDTAAALVPSNAVLAASNRPTSYTSNQAYTASPFFTLPSPVQFSTPAGGGSSKTFAIFDNENPNATWSLYFNSTVHSDGDGVNNGWCVSLLENPPVLTATKGPSGLHVVQGQTGRAVTVVVHNATGPGSAGGVSPVVVTDTFAAGLTPTGCSGTNWTQDSIVAQTITCHSTEFIASGNDFDTLTINFSVGNTATVGSVNNTAVITGSGQAVAGVNSNVLSITIDPAPVLGVTKAPVGTFTQGATGEWDVTVSNTKAGSATLGTTTIVDTLPANYTLSSFASTGNAWTCGTSLVPPTTTVTCTATTVVAGLSSFPVLQLFVNIPAASPISAVNNVVAFGGGDVNHTTSGNGATGSNTATVVQVPKTINISGGNSQTVLINTQFPTAFSVTVLDAGGVVIASTPVVFTAPASGASGTFANTTNTTTVNTIGTGVATATAFTANATAGSYSVSVTAGPATNSFSATNIQPVILSVTPNSGQQGATIASVALVGQNTHFVQGTSVANFGALITINSLTVTDATHASANITIQSGATIGARNVTVTTGSESASLTAGFTVTAGTPVLLSATPNSGQQGATIASVALVGQFTHFVQGTSTVDFGALITVNSLTVTDATHASANITIQSGAATGARNVTVTTTPEAVTLTSGFTVTVGTPVLLSVTPNSGAQGATIASVALVGQFTHFVQGTSTVSFGLGITVNSLTVTDATHASANITIQPGAATGNRDVTVTTTPEVVTLTSGFAVGAGTPVLQSVTPNSGQQGATIASVALVGQFTHFGGTSVADFGLGITINSLTVSDATHASANITIQPAATIGAHNVIVTTGGEMVTLTNGFTVTSGTPVLVSATPNSGQQGATIASVALVGQFTHFVQGTSTVDFGALITINSLTVTDSTHASANITIQAAAAVGAHNVTVNTSGEIVTLTNGFTVTVGSSCTPPTDVTEHADRSRQAGSTSTYLTGITSKRSR